MIDGEFHITLNGVNYRLAEDAEGDHYILDTPTLRAPNSQLVQGASSSLVNLSPDVLMWSIDDWSGGEGQLRFDPEFPNRSEVIEGINFFGRPGDMFLGYEPTITQATGGGDFADEVGLVVARNELYAVGIGASSDDYYAWDGPADWGAATSVSGTTDGARSALAIAGDGQYLFFVQHNTVNIRRWDGSSWTNHNNQTTNDACQLAARGDYLYKLNQDGLVYEVSKVTANSSTPETAILDFSAEGDIQRFDRRKIVTGDQRVYVMATYKYETVIYEIIPTTPAQTGFGREMLRMQGMRGGSIWFHGGFLYWTGVDNEADGSVGANRVLYYLQPGASYGSLGELRSFYTDQPVPGGVFMMGASALNTFALVGPATRSGVTPAAAEIDLWQVDAIGGGFGVVGRGSPLSLGEHYEPTSMQFFEGKIFVSVTEEDGGGTDKVLFWDISDYDTAGLTISPAHNFGIAADKVLQSIETVLEPLPASTSVTISYSLDGAAWADLTTNADDNSTGTLEVVSTDSAVKTFRSLRIKIALVGTASATPVVKAVNVRASVNETYKVWQVLLDASDESAPRGWNGAKLYAALEALSNSVVEFKDGYKDRTPGVWTSHDVIVEKVTLIGSQPGEGYVQVLLREVT
jgi:hypothetical protein